MDFSQTAKTEEQKTSASIQEVVDKALVMFNEEKAKKRYENRPKSLGAGRIGHPMARDGYNRGCARALFYEYKQFPKDEGRGFKADLYRVFDMGHDAEERMAGYLRQGGFNLLTDKPDGSQYGFELYPDPETQIPRMRGFVDGIFIDGPPKIDDRPLVYPFLWECKALKDNKWKEMVRKGVEVSHAGYYSQVQIYMAVMDLKEHPALLTATNRNTGEVHYEFIPFNERHAQAIIDRAVNVLTTTNPLELPKAAYDYTHLPCKWCDYRGTCERQEEETKQPKPNQPPTFWENK